MKIFWAQVWLIIRNDLRLQRRSSRASALLNGGVLAGFSVLFHFITIAIYASVSAQPSLQVEGVIWWIFAFIMLGTAMNAAIGSLYERADFDLLLSSPLSVRAVLFARLGSMAAVAFLSVAVFVPALLDPAIFFFSPHYLAGFAVWLLLAATAAALGTAFTLGLTSLLGARRARTISQIIAALLGTSVYLASQLPNLLMNSVGEDVLRRFYARIGQWPAFLLPAEAGRGQAGALVLLVVLTTGALALTVRLLSRFFVSGLQDIAAVPAKKRSGGRHRWNEGLAAATFWKDIRLITRDPLLLAQILPQTLYMLPLGFSLYRWLGLGALAPASFILGLILSSALTTIAVAGEECWDLVRMSPSPELRLRTAKMAAGMAVPLLVVVALSLVLAAAGRPGLGALTFLISFACSAALSRLSVASVIITPRRDLIRPGVFRSGGPGGSARKQLFPSFYFMITGGGGLGCAASGKIPIASAILLTLALLGAAACFAFVKFDQIIWRDDRVGT